MPIYEYRCQSCGHISEFLIRSFENTEHPNCPVCGSNDLNRLLSVSGVLKEKYNHSGSTCCGRTERCDRPPCSSGGECARD